jgi:hypothetical protein
MCLDEERKDFNMKFEQRGIDPGSGGYYDAEKRLIALEKEHGEGWWRKPEHEDLCNKTIFFNGQSVVDEIDFFLTHASVDELKVSLVRSLSKVFN